MYKDIRKLPFLSAQGEGTKLRDVHILSLSCGTGSPTTGSSDFRLVVFQRHSSPRLSVKCRLGRVSPGLVKIFDLNLVLFKCWFRVLNCLLWGLKCRFWGH